MTISKMMLALAVATVVAFAGSARGALVDSFSTSQGPLTVDGMSTTASSTVASGGGDILGGERDIQVMQTSGDSTTTVQVLGMQGRLEHGQGSDATAMTLITWDGVDGDAMTLDATVGLGGIDLTAGGLDNRFTLRVLLNDFSTDLTMTVWSSATNASEEIVSTGGGIGAPVLFDFFYADFDPVAGMMAADFENATAIQLKINGPTGATDIALDFIETTQEIPVPAALPGGLALLGLAGMGAWRRRRAA